jgi:ribosome-associated protein
MSEDLTVTDQLILPGTDLIWTAVRSAGPGGQNVNKVSTRVELRFDLNGCAVLPVAVKDRLRHLARNRMDADGRILLTSQKTRSQEQNLADARLRLAELVLEALVPPKPRRPTRPTKGSKERRLEGKRHRAEIKRGRGGVD